ncbi:MAG: hypothetical protein BLITH_0704 [Brockia lithotrophica]|uniref:DUF1614 domain-containing protein n=1 Tax=Brockia lithotrophica TaxID=933949 RepID=A0A2T5G8L1_9BACL|nr:DUF1614 domain-containing protein [Brockia lithotrophica]PTQ52525.1 MAG: hypothetical protein BLITH_0704 [Brockia lithotrophica]
MPFLWPIFLLLLLPFLLLNLYFQLVTFSFAKLGLTPEGATLLLLISLFGSFINIPISRTRTYAPPEPVGYFRGPFWVYYRPPRVQETILAVNVGGAIVPTVFSLYLLTRTPLLPALLATAIVTVVVHLLARPVPGVGIQVPALLPPLVSAFVAILLGGEYAPAVAYISGALGTLIGADLLNLSRIRSLGGQVMSIGGAGVFDGIFLVGIFSALLA